MKHVKVVLLEEVQGIGGPGTVKDVAEGYARNYLLPRKFATAWTKGGQKQVDAITAGRAKRDLQTAEAATSTKARLEGAPVTVTARAGATGRLFGAVTASEIAEAIAAAGGPQVDRRRIEVPTPIRNTGDHTAHVRLHDEVSATVTVHVTTV